jgi:Ser/Thr protein kinase RdoA (MazF antagonist)
LLIPPIHLWALEAPLIPLTGGHRNIAFRTFGLSSDVVFKTTRREPAAIEWLIPVFTLAEQSGFIVPRPIRSTEGHLIEQGWTCEPFIHGQTCRPADMARLGAQLSRFRDATKTIQQRPGFLTARDLTHLDRGGDVDLSLLPPHLVTACREAWSKIEHEPVCVVHGDLNPSNIIWTADHRAALLDWDECRVDAALFDTIQFAPDHADCAARTAAAAWEVACSWQLEPAHAQTVAAATFLRLIAGPT